MYTPARIATERKDPYRETDHPACVCDCHDAHARRARRGVLFKKSSWVLGGVFIAFVLTYVLHRVLWTIDENDLHQTRGWKEEHEPCRDTVTAIGPSTGLPVEATCRNDQFAATHDVEGGNTVVTCSCWRKMPEWVKP